MSNRIFAAALALATAGAAMAANSGAAEAHRRHHHHRGYVAAGVVGGVMVGAAIASPRYYGGPHYYNYGHRPYVSQPTVVYVPAYSSGSLPTYWSADGCRTSHYAIPSTYDGYGCCAYRRGCGRW